MAPFRMVFAVCGILSVILPAGGVKITKLYVPRGASHEAPLDCKYDLESDQLYDVKWYKDGLQFFRCEPNGKTTEYPVEGVKVFAPLKEGVKSEKNLAVLGSCSLTLMMLSKKSAGEYKCEVSTEGPAFKTAVAYGYLRIIESSRRVQNETKDKSLGEGANDGNNDNDISSSTGLRISHGYGLLLYVPTLLIKYIIY